MVSQSNQPPYRLHTRHGDPRSISLAELSLDQLENLVYTLFDELPLSRLARIHRRLLPLVKFDIIGVRRLTGHIQSANFIQLLPDEIALHILQQLSYEDILDCALVSRRWLTLTNDTAVWRHLCDEKKWKWKQPSGFRNRALEAKCEDMSDEGVDEVDDEDEESSTDSERAIFEELDSGLLSLTFNESASSNLPFLPLSPLGKAGLRSHGGKRATKPSVYRNWPANQPNYKQLYQTQTLLRSRILHSSYHLTTLQSSGSLDSHSATIYCLQLFDLPGTDRQVLYTGSKDKTIRRWDMRTGQTESILEGVHTGSVLSLSVDGQYLISGGSDHLIVVWDVDTGKPIKVLAEHRDSVLCVRHDSKRLVTCSKDRTVRTYLLPDFVPDLVFSHHLARVNTVALSTTQIISASGDRSVRVWDASTGELIRTFENHHFRGIASIAFSEDCIVSGSSDKHLRYQPLSQDRGWTTSSVIAPVLQDGGGSTLTSGGSIGAGVRQFVQRRHFDLVRSVALGQQFVVSGSYDTTVKVWERETGTLVADLTGGHTGRIFCVGFDGTKIVSCGEDQRICVWDFSHGLDTSFLQV